MRIALLAAGICLIASTDALSQEAPIPERLTLADALQMAEDRNPTLGAARDAVEIARAERVGASLRPNPAFSATSEGFPLFQASRPAFFNAQEFTVRVDQEIETAGRRRLRTQAADAGVEAVRASLANERRRLRLEVRRVYFQAALAKADREVARAALGEIDKVISLNRARVEKGETSGAEVRRLQVERLRFVDDVFTAELGYRNARSALLALLNVRDLGQSFDVVEPLAAPPEQRERFRVAPVGDVPAPDPMPQQAQALANRPDLLAAHREVQRAETETRLQRALRTPNATIGGGYRRDFGANAIAVGVTIPLPILNRNQGGVARADAERRLAANRAVAAELTVLLEVQQAANAVAINRARVEYIEREYRNNARQARDIVLASYRLGAANLIDFLDAQRAFRDTLRTYNRALYEERISLFELQAALGEPDGRAGSGQE